MIWRKLRLIAAAIAADAGTGRGAGGHLIRVDDLAGADVDVAGLVVCFDPGLVALVAHADVEREAWAWP